MLNKKYIAFGPIYFFLTDIKYGINWVIQFETVCKVGGKSTQIHAVIYSLTFWSRNYFFLILAHPVYKMRIIQEPNTIELWNKLHFEEEKTESIHHI